MTNQKLNQNQKNVPKYIFNQAKNIETKTEEMVLESILLVLSDAQKSY